MMPEECDTFDLMCKAGRGLGGVAGGVAARAAGNVIEAMADAVLEAVGKTLASLGTAWVTIGTPNLTTSTGGATPSDAVGFLQDSLWWYMGAAAVLAVIVGGAKMVWDNRAEPGQELVKSMLTLVIVSGAGLTAIALAVTAADEFSVWIIDRSTEDNDFGKNVVGLIALTTAATAATGAAGLGPLLIIILGIIAILVSLIQIMLMVARGGMLVILAGILPLTASFTNLEMGRDWFKKCVAWLIAWILYKPAAAIVYATAFRLVGTEDVFTNDDESGLLNVLVGIILMIMSLFALPALMRFVTPMVGAISSGGGGGLVSTAVSVLPTGAMAAGAFRTSGAGHAPQAPGGEDGAPSPSGSQSDGGGAPQSADASTGDPASNGRGQSASRPALPAGGASGEGNEDGSGSQGEESAGGPTGADDEATGAGSRGGVGTTTGAGAVPTGGGGGGGATTDAGAAAGVAGGPVGAPAVAGKQAGEALARGVRDGAETATNDESKDGGPRGSNG